MVSLMIESLCNNIKTKGILKDNSNLKIYLQTILENKIDEFNKLYSLKSNLEFEELGTDLLTKLKYSKGAIYSLNKRNYSETDISSYNFENLNSILSISEINVIKKENECFVDFISLTSKENEKQYSFFCQDDYILFIPSISNSTVEYYYKLNGYKVLDFKIDKYLFVYILLEKDNEQYLAISHLCKPFSKYNSDDSTLDKSKCYNFIKLKTQNKLSSLEYINNSDYYFTDENFKIVKIKFCKKYYFKDGDFIYFNNQGDCDDFSDLFLEVVQNNFLNMYNYLNFLGLNDFQISGRKISTKENDLFLEIFKNKFDNTLNGGLNYFNAKKIDYPYISKELRAAYNKNKDYHININDEYFSIKGNFVYKNYNKGNYKIEVFEDKVNLYQIEDVITLIDTVYISSYKEFYFCNLKFTFKKFEFPLEPYSFHVSSNSPYLFKQSQIKNYKLYSVPNNKKSINDFIENSEENEMDINTNFDGKKLIFYNYYDWKNKKYKYGNVSKQLTNKDIIDINGFKKYVCLSNYIEKNNKIYSRNFGILNYTNTDNFNFELINSKGYITPFWVNNQDKIIYFKNIYNSVVLTDNKYESDFYCYIPKIQNYIRYNNKMYSNVSVSINDNLEVEANNNGNLLITNKYLNEPLFYKVYIEDSDLLNIRIFDNDNKEISNYIQEPFNSGYIFYFNIEKNKKYYYNTSSSKYNYFEPVESYKNIEFVYYFNETGYINLDNPKHLTTFTLKSKVLIEKDVTFSLFLYNTLTGETNKFSLSKNELNNKFEIDLNINKILLEIDSSEYSKDMFYIVEDSNNSLNSDNVTIFFKNDRKDIVYIAEKNLDIDPKKIDFTKLKVNTYYNINDYNNIIETYDGSFIIDSLNAGEIAIIPNISKNNYVEANIFLTESLGDPNDNFYRTNFKAPSSFYINHDISSIKIADTTNIDISADDIFISNGGSN